MKKIILDAHKMQEKNETYNYLKKKMGLPEYFGGNADALYDCLSELKDTEIVIKNIRDKGDFFDVVSAVMEDVKEANEYIAITLEK